jgi:hypothetical protein
VRRSELRISLAAAVATLAFAVGLPLALGACGGEGESKADESKARIATHKDFDRANFSDSTTIDNKWSPLEPGMQFTYEGRSNRGLGRLPHRIVFTVTDLTKEIDGVRSVMLWDRDYNGGKLLEGELAFFAQDDDGNVWNMGEYPEEYDKEGNGTFVAAPDTWFSGIDRARAGILMRGDPQPGTPRYRQGFAPTIEFNDVAFVQKTGQKSCVPMGCYEDVLVTDETNPTEPHDGHQLKYYAPGVGNIQAAPGKGGKEREILQLVKVIELTPGAMEFARKGALKLERRAYVKRKDVYGPTPPSEPRAR